LRHAAAHDLRRLVYVIPFTSIVEQTATVFSKVIGDESVLEHHSAFDWKTVDDQTEVEQRRLSSISWDYPVVVTTAVQFFESLFAARKKRCRKLHNLACSVIVLDETQMLPRPFLRPCLAALRELVEGYGASVVLCTATQPSLTRESGFPAAEALDSVFELAPNPPKLYERLRRVAVEDIGLQQDVELAQQITSNDQVLLIVDNRIQARQLFNQVASAEGAAHLSTLMTASHRQAVLANVRVRLSSGLPARLISTSLIEAGVDVDFPLVLRSATGIDSLAQAAGRCNREGRLTDMGRMLVFQTEHAIPPVIEDAAIKGRDVLSRHADPLSLEAVTDYFNLLWRSYGADGLDSAKVDGVGGGILKSITAGRLRCSFEDIEKAFSLIGANQNILVIRGGKYGIPEDQLEKLRWRSSNSVARELQPYTVSVPYRVWQELWSSSSIAWWESGVFGEQFGMLETSDFYDEEAGLAVDRFDNHGAFIA